MIGLIRVDFLCLYRKIVLARYFCHYCLGVFMDNFIGKYSPMVFSDKNNVVLYQKFSMVLGFVLHNFYIDGINWYWIQVGGTFCI